MSRARRPGARQSHALRQTLAVGALTAVLALGVLASGEYLSLRPRSPAIAVVPDDDDIYTGSILYMPYEGNICRQILFDNHTGRLSDNGRVDCDGAAYNGNSPQQWSFARARIISTGFRDR